MLVLSFKLIVTSLFVFLLLANFSYAQLSGHVLISEIYYNTPDDLSKEFVEFTVRDYDGLDIDTNGWVLTTFDGNNYTLPSIVGLNNNDYVSIRAGSGISDTDASDGSATIFLGLGSELLDDISDEVALYDSNGDLIDFVRYNGGNQGIVLGNWNPGDPGPVALNLQSSVQIHGSDLDSSENWISDVVSEASPNLFSTSLGNKIPVLMQNGLNREKIIEGVKFGSLNLSVINISPGLMLSELKIIEEMMNFSYNFYKSKGFNEPKTTKEGNINVSLTKNNKFGANANPSGVVDVDIGDNLSQLKIASFIKWNVEHEFYHLLEFEKIFPNGTANPAGTFVRDPVNKSNGNYAFLDEGSADYWGLEISKKQYNVTDDFLFNASVNISKNYSGTFNSIPYNFSDILRDFDFDLVNKSTGSGIKVYTHGFLFIRCVADIYGQNKIIHIHNITRNNITGLANETIGEAAVEKAFKDEGMPKSFAQIYTDCRAWIYQVYNGMVGLKSNQSFNGPPTGTADSITSWGTHYEKMTLNKSNFNSTGPYNISFKGAPGVTYGITILARNGTGGYSSINSSLFKGIGTIILKTNSTEIVIVKTQINSRSSAPSTNYEFNFTHTGLKNSTVKGVTLENSNLTNSFAQNSTIINSSKINSIIIDSRNAGSNVKDSIENNSRATKSTLEGSNLSDSNLTNSRMTNSSIKKSSVTNSNTTNSLKTNSIIINSVNIDDFVDNTFENKSRVVKSNVNSSRLIDTLIHNSTILNSTLISSNSTNSTIVNSSISKSKVTDSNLAKSFVVNSSISNSILINVTVINSTIVNSTKMNSIIIGSVDIGSFVNGSIENRSRIQNSNLTNITLKNSNVVNSTLRDLEIINLSIIGGIINDTSAPTCFWNLTYWPPNGSVNISDFGSGIKNITVQKLVGANLTPMPPLIFSPPTFEPVIINFVRTAQSVQIFLKIYDDNGNFIICDPLTVNVVRDKGKPQTQVFSEIPQEEDVITLKNDDPGLKNLDIKINKKLFRIKELKDNETRIIYVSSAMNSDNNNTISFTPHGKPGGSAEVTIWDKPNLP